MDTRTYLGDGVYASFDGHQIKLEANGTGAGASDTIFLDPSVLAGLVTWNREGHADYNTGKAWGK